MKRICKRCGTEVIAETDTELKKEYPYYCPECDENMYSFECEDLPEINNLRLIYDNANEERKDITLPMEKWISDWWFDCDVVPTNDTTIILAELDGVPILGSIPSTDVRYITFEEIAWHFNWDGLYDDFVGDIEGNVSMGNNKETFENWLKENVVEWKGIK